MEKSSRLKDWSDFMRPRAKDVKPYFNFKPFHVLKNKAIFDTVHVAGMLNEWVTGQDICPDELYFNSIALSN